MECVVLVDLEFLPVGGGGAQPGGGVAVDHPVGGDPARDAPPAVGAVGSLRRFHVLPGNQRQQRDRLGGIGAQLLVGQVAQETVGVADQTVHELLAGLRIVQAIAGLSGSLKSWAGQCSATTPAAPGT